MKREKTKKYLIIDLQETGMFSSLVFDSKEKIRKRLTDFHEQDYTGEISITDFTLEEVLEYGDWDIKEINLKEAKQIEKKNKKREEEEYEFYRKVESGEVKI